MPPVAKRAEQGVLTVPAGQQDPGEEHDDRQRDGEEYRTGSIHIQDEPLSS